MWESSSKLDECFSKLERLISLESRVEEGWMGGRVGEHGPEEAAGVGKRKHNHIASQTNAPPPMEMDRGSAFQSMLEISST